MTDGAGLPISDDRQKRGRLAWLAAALILGGLATLWNVLTLSPYVDEGYTLFVSAQPLPALLHELSGHDFQPPLFYVITHFLHAVIGGPIWHWRLLSAPLAFITIVCTWAITRRIADDKAAAVAALITAASPGLVLWDSLYRMYSALFALTVLSWWLLTKALEQPRPPKLAWWLAYGAAVIVLPYIHYLGLFVVLSQLIYSLVRCRGAWQAAVPAGASLILFAPWAVSAGAQAMHQGVLAQTPWRLGPWRDLPYFVLGRYLPIHWHANPIAVWLFAIAVYSLAAAGIILARRTALPFLFLTPALQAAGTLIFNKNFVFDERYLYDSVPAFAVAVGVVSSTCFRGRFRTGGLLLAVAAVGCSLVGSLNLSLLPYRQPANWYDVGALISQYGTASDVLVFVPVATWYAVSGLDGFAKHEMTTPQMTPAIRDTVAWASAHRNNRIWYIQNYYQATDPALTVRAQLSLRRRELRSWREPRFSEGDAVTVTLFDFAR